MIMPQGVFNLIRSPFKGYLLFKSFFFSRGIYYLNHFSFQGVFNLIQCFVHL